jgi:(1->4)-alpha-D-glucan 1-alpha-D-glucosylmutase
VPTDARATYRVQLHGGFGFEAAAAQASYLAALGVSHLYSSPILEAVPGSLHGYDVVNHSRVNGELGGERGRRLLADALLRAGLGQLLDVVPNHMAIHAANRWWWDVLENGPSSRYATYFDVDWDLPERALHNKVLLPVLGDHYGRVLDRGELRLLREGGTFLIRHHEHTWPAAPRSLDGLLAAAAERTGSEELGFLSESLGRLPLPRLDDRRGFQRRHRDKEALRSLLEQLLRGSSELAAAVDAEIDRANQDPDLMHAVLEGQNYRLAFWRVAARDLGYRRFFDVNSLVALRAEDERVFAETHLLVLDWLRQGALDGVRVDHPDGLRDPQDYFERLRAEAPRAWLVAEKILAAGESLPSAWPVDGTTGYDFARLALGLLVDPRSEAELTRVYADFLGEPPESFETVAREKKRFVLREVLGGDLNRLTALLAEVCERHRRHRDYTRHEQREALLELMAALPVYRTYVRADQGSLADVDRDHILSVVDRAAAERPDVDRALFEFIGAVLTLEVRGDLESELVMRFQQATGPVAAKGIEDTAFYTYNRLVALNEVGGDPGRLGVAPDEFHAWCEATWTRWPHTLLATATHDTKRGEDVRARLALLSEMPERWERAAGAWARRNEPRRAGRVDRNAEYLFYQTLVGAWPLEAERASAYMLKAAREAKEHTSWTRPDAGYEEALQGFVAGSLEDAGFRREVEAFVAPLVPLGRVNSLAQTLLKLVAPGVPDIYQGCELWDLSLVDPDNRRPVDYEARRRLLGELEGLSAEQVMARMDEGLPKLFLVRQALALRRRRPEAFGAGEEGRPRPLAASGRRAEHVVALARGADVIAVVPRLVASLAEKGWDDTALDLPPGRWTSVLDGTASSGGVKLADLLARFPVALLLHG